jgi:hypothetical protein
MDHVVKLWKGIEDLFTIKDAKNTTIFLLLSTILILWYRVAIPILMVSCAFWLLSNKYYHK